MTEDKGPSRAEVKEAVAVKREQNKAKQTAARKTSAGKASEKVRVRFLVNSIAHKRGDKVSVDKDTAARLVANRLA